MNNETATIFREQLSKMPSEVVDFISSTNWNEELDEIGALYNLSNEQLYSLKQEVALVLAGLIHPDEFIVALEQETGVKGSVLEAIVSSVEAKIFAPIRPALVGFLEKEEGVEETAEGKKEETAIPETPSPEETAVAETQTRELDIAPDNLPTVETESFLPKLMPKNIEPEPKVEAEKTHPFEEKMKEFFVEGQQPAQTNTIKVTTGETTPSEIKPETSRTYHTDPYREPIE